MGGLVIPDVPAWLKYCKDGSEELITPVSLHADPFLSEAEGDGFKPESNPSKSSLRGLHPENWS